jgi:hypothetical protein
MIARIRHFRSPEKVCARGLRARKIARSTLQDGVWLSLTQIKPTADSALRRPAARLCHQEAQAAVAPNGWWVTLRPGVSASTLLEEFAIA